MNYYIKLTITAAIGERRETGFIDADVPVEALNQFSGNPFRKHSITSLIDVVSNIVHRDAKANYDDKDELKIEVSPHASCGHTWANKEMNFTVSRHLLGNDFVARHVSYRLIDIAIDNTINELTNILKAELPHDEIPFQS